MMLFSAHKKKLGWNSRVLGMKLAITGLLDVSISFLLLLLRNVEKRVITL